MRHADAFPTLDAAQIARIRAAGHERTFRAGEILFDQGEAAVTFLVILEGSVEVVHPYDAGEHLITVHEPGSFTGEFTLLAGRRSLVRGRARTAGRAIELDRTSLRAAIASDAELSEIVMRAFILRRLGLISDERGDVVLVGSRHSSGTLRVKEFLTRNGHPHTTIDVERDPSAQALLDQFGVGIAD
ncbi:MAG: cyclic nucleotide-binding domain-containing protein, partial [Solirubrobacteraceae bacterium]